MCIYKRSKMKSKQRMDREVRIKVQDILYNNFREKCEKEYKTVSIVIRDLMAKYLEEKNG
jgi:hypothetical protein